MEKNDSTKKNVYNLQDLGVIWQTYHLPCKSKMKSACDKTLSIFINNYSHNNINTLNTDELPEQIGDKLYVPAETQTEKLIRDMPYGFYKEILEDLNDNYKNIDNLSIIKNYFWLNNFSKILTHYRIKPDSVVLSKILMEIKAYFEDPSNEFLSFFFKVSSKNKSEKLAVTSPIIYNGKVQSVVEFLGEIHHNTWYDETYNWITPENIQKLLLSGIKYIPSQKLNYFAIIRQPLTESVSINEFFGLIERNPKYLDDNFDNLFEDLSKMHQLSEHDKKIIELEKQLIDLCLEVKRENNFYIEEPYTEYILEEICNRRVRFFVGCLANAKYPEVLCKLLFNKNFISNVLYIPHINNFGKPVNYFGDPNMRFDGFDAIIYCVSNAADEELATKFVKKSVKMINKYFKKVNFEEYTYTDKYPYPSKSKIESLFQINSSLSIMVKNAIDICSSDVSKPIINETPESLSVYMDPGYKYYDVDKVPPVRKK